MKKTLFFIVFLFMAKLGFAQKTVYFFPGQGSDHRVFDKIILDSNYKKVCLSYPIPEKGMTMRDYAFVIARDIDTSKPYCFIGLSMGGMLISELVSVYRPEKAIIISSAKCRDELPGRYRFQKYVPLNKLVPKGLVKAGALVLQPLVEPDRNSDKETFKSMLHAKDALYLKRTVNLIINWEKQAIDTNIVHIHGSNDHTLPLRFVEPDEVIEHGSHMMALTRGAELNVKILELLR